MKKILSFCLMSMMLLSQAALCTPNTSENAFEIPITEVPPGGSNGSGGLSDGAITAIALGSVFGGLAALSGIGYYFYKNNIALKAGKIMGEKCPYNTICIKDDSLLAKLKTCPEDNKYLIRAFNCTNPDDCQNKSFLVLKDTSVLNKTYNTVYFELPEIHGNTNLNFRIIQFSEPYTMNGKMPSLDTKILLNAKAKDVKEVPTTVSKNDPQNGILIKQGQIKEIKNKIAAINTSYDMNSKTTEKKVYALIVEFYK